MSQNLPYSSCQFRNDKSIPLQMNAMTYRTPLLNFKLILQFLLWTKGSHQSPNFVTFKCSGENLPKFSCYFSKHKVSFSSNFATIFHVMKDNSSVLFHLTIIYFGHKESIKQFFRLLSAQVKICQIIHVNFKTPFLYHSSFIIVATHNSSVNFELIHFLLWTKGSHQSPKFHIFECSVESLPNFLCHFPNHKSVHFFFKFCIFSMSWKVTYFKWCIGYFGILLCTHHVT